MAKALKASLYLSLILTAIIASIGNASAWLKISGEFNPERVSGAMHTGPHQTCFAPDGSWVTFLRKGLIVYDTQSRSAREMPIVGRPFSLSCASDGSVLVLARFGDETRFNSIDVKTHETKTKILSFNPTAAYPIYGTNKVIFLIQDYADTKIGIEVLFAMFIYDGDTGTMSSTYENRRIIGGWQGLTRFTGGWIYAPQNPIDPYMFVLMEVIDPPALPPYIKIIAVDALTGIEHELIRQDYMAYDSIGGWMPDGRYMLLSDIDGKLFKLGLDGTMKIFQSSNYLHMPSYNPAGGLIYASGELISSDGTLINTIIKNGSGSIGVWSPDGGRLLILNKNTLWILAGFKTAPAITQDTGIKNSLSALKDLYLSGTITKNDLQERYLKLISSGVANIPSDGTKQH